MKKNYLVRMIAAAVAATLLNTTVAFAGSWEQKNDLWTYLKDNGQHARAEWIQDKDGSWYYLGINGYMETNRIIDGYYIGTDGKIVLKQDENDPLYGEAIYGTHYMSVNSYQDKGDFYRAKVTFYDSSFGTSEDFGRYHVGDKFWIEIEGAYGTVKKVKRYSSGEIGLDVKYKDFMYWYSQDSTVLQDEYGEGYVFRKIKENVEIEIPKNITIEEAAYGTYGKKSLSEFLNLQEYKMIPVFKGTTVEKLYDNGIYNAG